MLANVTNNMYDDGTGGASAHEEDTLASFADDMDSFWLCFAAALVFFMQAGFTMLEVAAVREIAIKSILLKNVFDASLAALLWYSFGYAFAFGQDSFSDTGHNGFIGTSGFFYSGEGSGEDASPLTQTPHAKTHGKSLFVFNWAFCGVAATIVSGAVAERCKILAYILYSITITSIIYPIVVHAAWSVDGRFSAQRENRLLFGCGVIDFAGSAVVHLTGGTAALIAAIGCGPREGRFSSLASPLPLRHSSAFQTLGALILWFGWYGFNIGSTGAIIGNGGLASHVFMTTTLGASTGCLATTAFGYVLDPDNKALVQNANNGILAGLVSVTAGCATSNLWGSILTAFVASVIYCSVSRLLVRLKVDDPVDAFAVHGACGLWGVIAASLFATPYYYSLAYDADRADRCASVFYGGNAASFFAAVCFALYVMAWVLATATLAIITIHHVVPGGVRMALEAHATWEHALSVDDLEMSELVRLDNDEKAETASKSTAEDVRMRSERMTALRAQRSQQSSMRSLRSEITQVAEEAPET
mmetsp:Transcript_2583/g.8035  ORF Transcript_2583/g.8035 Transcript_2583/m.8035 type:complete len:532 (+) Transcript_2583:53-1648(+)